jgi:hypothetical protein
LRFFTAISLLIIHTFNIVGYRLLFDAMETKATAAFVQKLDEEKYDDSQLIEMKVALPMPYQTNWAEFERYDGEIEINGVHYNYVKRKVFNDTLILMCIPNTDKMKLNSAKEQFFSLVNDISTDQTETPQPSKSSTIKTITSDYQYVHYEISISCPVVEGSRFIVTHSTIPLSVFSEKPFQPPRV